jgi:hypothetical protein
MDAIVMALLAELDAMDIAAKEDRGEVYLKPAPPQHLAARLRANKEAVANALWAKAGRARQQEALARLAADRQAWIEECKRLGLYRGPE